MHPAQGAFLRIDAKPCDLAELVTHVLFVHASKLRTLLDPARLPSLSGKSCCVDLPCALLARLAATLDPAGKMRLTDLCNRHSTQAPVLRSTPEPAACAAMTASAMC
jgi:hypothetical protein